MIRKVFSMVILASLFSAASVLAADVKMKFTLEDAMMYSQVSQVMEGAIAMHWGEKPGLKVEEKLGTFKTSKRTNAFMKEESEACAHALASALIELHERAVNEGGNAVINIVSNIKNHEESSETEYSCLVGSVMVNVALKGTVATIK